MYIPWIIYGFLFYGQEFPKSQNEMDKASTGSNLQAMFSSPLYWFMLVCMVMTATTELGTQSWVENTWQHRRPAFIGFILSYRLDGDRKIVCRPHHS